MRDHDSRSGSVFGKDNGTMIMITGGIHQGKTAYAMRKIGLAESDIADGADCNFDALKNVRCILNYHDIVKRLGDRSVTFTEELCRSNPDAVIIINEIGCGIVPIEKSERIWRENVGRCGCIIAANSEKVIRIVCGIPDIIKGENE